MSQCRPLFATPTLTGMVAYEFAGSCSQMSGALARKGIEFYHTFRPGVPFVDAARNLCVSEFLLDHKDATDLFFLDDDIGFPAHKVLEFLERDEEIVCGTYCLKKDGQVEFPVILALDNNKPITQNGLYRALNIPAGFLRMKRSAVETLAKNAETYLFPEKDKPPRLVFNVFTMGPLRGEYVGEDVMLCRKCHDLGIDLWVDPNIDFHHRGGKRWEANFSPTLNTWISQQEAKP